MQKQNKKALLAICVAVAAVLLIGAAVILALLGGQRGTSTTEPPETTDPSQTNTGYTLYWNLDREMYAELSGKETARVPEADGYYHMRFMCDGELLDVRLENAKLVRDIDRADDLVQLEFDENGIAVDVTYLTRLPLRTLAYDFYVQELSEDGVLCNSTSTFDGDEVQFQVTDDIKVMDMTGTTGPVGCLTELAYLDVVMVIQNIQGQITHVFVTGRENYMVSHNGFCQHCQQDVVWYEWTNENLLPTQSGHYQLMNHIRPWAQNNIQKNAAVCLDLNGKTVSNDRTTGRLYSLHNEGCSLAIMDTTEEQKGKLVSRGEIFAHGGIIWGRYGQLHLYSGTVDASQLVNNGGNGTAILIAYGASFHMHGGTVIGGTAAPMWDEGSNGYVNGTAGSVFCSGDMIMDGGVIRDGYSKAISYYENGKLVNKRGVAGNLSLSAGATLVMNGGTIQNGISGGLGGNMYVNGEFTMNGGTITGGRIVNNGSTGGNIYVGDESVTTINSGSITDGIARNHAGNFYIAGKVIVNGGSITGGKVRNLETGEFIKESTSRNIFLVNGTYEMYGGYLNGGLSAYDTEKNDGRQTTVRLGGSAKIYNDSDLTNLSLSETGDGVKVYVDYMNGDAKVGITGGGVFTQPTYEANRNKFFSDAGADISYYRGCLAIGREQCMCSSTGDEHTDWCDQTVRFWSAWTMRDRMPTNTGYYYLINDTVCTVTGGVAEGEHVVLDLNGKTVTAKPDSRFYNVINKNATLSLTDTEGSGKVVRAKKEAYTGHGGLLWGAETNTINIYGGTYDGEQIENQSKGGVLLIAGTANMYGGTLKNGKSVYGGNVVVEKNGTMNLYGGTIADGSATSVGGNIHVVGTLNIHGGTICGGISPEMGGNIFLKSGTVNMYGGTLSGGKSSGGNILVDINGVFNLSGGSVIDGVSLGENWAGNVVLMGNMNMTGGVISGGMVVEDTTSARANLSLRYADSTLNMSGGTITGRVCGFLEPGRINLSGSAKIWNENGGNQITLTKAVLTQIAVIGALDETGKIGLTTDVIDTALVTGDSELLKAVANTVIVAGESQELISKEQGLYMQPKGLKNYCLCGGKAVGVGNHVCADVQWLPWTSDNTLPMSSGNYYLTKPVVLTESSGFGKGHTVALDLNGFSITVAEGNSTMYFVDKGSNTLHLTDSVGGGVIQRPEQESIKRSGGFIFGNDTSVVNIYAGTLDGKNVPNTGGGGLIYTEGTLNVYGGTLQNGSAANGGNVYLGAGGTMNLYSGTVQGGNATNRGGNINVYDGCFLNIKGGTVQNGTAGGWADNIYLFKAEMAMEDGTIFTTSTTKDNSNLVLHEAVATISGGTINGHVTAAVSATLNLSGDPVIYKEGSQYNVKTNGMTIKLTDALEETAKIGVYTTLPDGTVIVTGTEEHLKAAANTTILSSNADKELAWKDAGLVLQIKGLKEYCICGGKAVGVGDHVCEDVQWVPWDTGDSLPMTSGNYYLTKPVIMTESSGISKNNTIALDLCGHSITLAEGDSTMYFADKGGNTLHITDSVGGGVIQRPEQTSVNRTGGFVLGNGTSVINLYAGVLDGKNVPNTGAGGGIIYTEGVFNMYGGTLQNGCAVGGGNVYLGAGGTMNLYRGTVQGGNATNRGGNINVYDGCFLNIKGGTVLNGTAGGWADNIYVFKAEMTMEDGSVSTTSTTKDNSNLVLHEAVATISGGTINGHVTAAVSATLKLSGNPVIYKEGSQYNMKTNGMTIQLTDALEETAKIGVYTTLPDGTVIVTGAEEHLKAAANTTILSSNADKELAWKSEGLFLQAKGLKNYCICGGKTNNVGNHICADVQWMPWSDGTKLPDMAGNWYLTGPVEVSGVISIPSNTAIGLDLNGQTVTVKDTARVYRFIGASGSTLSITDSQKDGKIFRQGSGSAGHGGIIWMAATGNTFNLYGGILDGSGIHNSGNGGVILSQGIFNMYGGTVKGGYSTNTAEAGDGGGNIRVHSGIMNLYGGTVEGGYAVQRGGNINVNAGATLNIKGGIIQGGDSTGWGGNLYAKNATVEMTAGEVKNPVIGQTPTYNENVSLHSSVLTMSGGYISGYVDLVETAAVNLSGSAKIYAPTENQNGIRVPSAATVKATGAFNTDAKIVLTGSNNALAVQSSETYTLVQEDVQYFVPTLITQTVEFTDGKLYLRYNG